MWRAGQHHEPPGEVERLQAQVAELQVRLDAALAREQHERERVRALLRRVGR